jgi:GDP/UDP-N,N'-diacetylbacillosamine 2-epimerase (hydrolysing)
MSTDKKHIGVLSGKRGGFDAMLPMLRIMDKSEDYKLSLYLADMHNMEKFGSTGGGVQTELPNSHITYLSPIGHKDSGWGRAKNLCQYGTHLADVLDIYPIDCLLLYGDRGESLSAAMVACQMRVPIGHIQGGDTSGTTDNAMRHAISMLSQWHFVSHQRAADTLVDMAVARRDIIEGSPLSKSIFIVGDSHIDPIIEGDMVDGGIVRKELHLDPDLPVVVLLQHPDDPATAGDEIWETIMALKRIKCQIVAVYPCSDPGYSEIVNALEDRTAVWDNIQVHKNLPGPSFRGLLAIADCLVGNSSCGIIEAPYYRLPAVDIGDRQNGRMMVPTTLRVTPERTRIEIAILECLSLPESTDFRRSYGEGHTGETIIALLEDLL